MKAIVQSVLDKYNLTLESYVRSPDGGSKRSHIAYVLNAHSKELTLKLFDSEDEVALVRFIREIKNIRMLRSRLRNGYKNWVPKILYFSMDGDHPYYIYERIEGVNVGKFIESYGFNWGIFKHKNFMHFIEFFDVLEALEVESELPKWTTRHVRKEIQYYFEHVKGLLPSDMYDKVFSFYEKNQKYLTTDLVLSHRDLYPENIMVLHPGSSKFTFLDWEYLSRVPRGYNAAFLYLNFWKEEYWKAKVFSHFFNKYCDDKQKIRSFLISFRLCLMILSIRFIYQLETYGEGKADIHRNAKLAFLYDLTQSLSGEIVKPRNIKFLIDIYDIQKVADEYNLGKVDKYEIFYASKGNTVAKVILADKRQLIFRFYSNSRSVGLIKRELGIFEKLRQNGIKTYEVIRTPQDNLYLEKELYGKVRKVAVLTFVQGGKIRHKWANEDAIKQAGALLKKMHNVDIIHGDYSKENVLYIKGKISGVIDLEWGRITKSKEAKIHDLAKAIALWLIDTRGRLIPESEVILNFIIGYFDRSLNDQELEDLLDIVIQKIEYERSVFMTTIDTNEHRHAGTRFDNAVDEVTNLMPSGKA